MAQEGSEEAHSSNEKPRVFFFKPEEKTWEIPMELVDFADETLFKLTKHGGYETQFNFHEYLFRALFVADACRKRDRGHGLILEKQLGGAIPDDDEFLKICFTMETVSQDLESIEKFLQIRAAMKEAYGEDVVTKLESLLGIDSAGLNLAEVSAFDGADVKAMVSFFELSQYHVNSGYASLRAKQRPDSQVDVARETGSLLQAVLQKLKALFKRGTA